jgi:phosphatidylserine synthase
MNNKVRVRNAKFVAISVFVLASVFLVTAMTVHDAWPEPIAGWFVGVAYALLGILTIHNFLVGSHRGHVVYMRMLWVYLAITFVFLVRSFGLLLGLPYWVAGASLIFLLWLVIRPYQGQIQRERKLGISKDYFLDY